MKKFKSVREYMDLKSICDFCGSSIEPSIVSKKKPNYLPTYSMNFSQTTFYTDVERDILWAFKNMDKEDTIKFSSSLDGNALNFYYSIEEEKHKIFAVDVDTNKIAGNIDRVQRVIWDHQLSILLACSSCRQGYISESTPIYLERRNGIIFPIWMASEAIVVDLYPQKKEYILFHSPPLKSTILYSHDNKEVVKKFPSMSLYSISGKDNIINKIKTILVFS